MSRTFEEIYQSKSKFLKRYIDNLLRTKGIGDFVRQVYLRAVRLFPEDTRKDFNYDRIRKHLNSKFTRKEMNIILQEKERRLVNKKYIENLKQQFQYQKSKYKRKARRLRKVEALLLRGMGCSYNRIADELGMHPVTVKELITDQRLRVKKETEYLKNVLNVIVRSIEEKKEENNMKQPVENILKELTKDELYDLLQNLLRNNPGIKTQVLEWLKDRENNNKLDDELIMEYWSNAWYIIDEFNQYGGGPREDEYEAFDWLDKIIDLLKEGNISDKTRLNLINSVFEEYKEDNSGFEDILIDIMFKACQTEDDWKYLAEKLKGTGSRWDREIVMKIYRDHLHDDEAYVEERKENLEMGMDYFDLAYFYIRKNKQKQAIDIMEEGITKGMGNLSKLFNYLANYYARREDLSNLKRIVNLSLKKKSSEVAVLNVLFDLYMKNSEYDKAVETMLKSIDYIGRSGYVEQYKKIRANFKGENLKLIERKLLETARKKNLREYLDICLEMGLKKDVIFVILNLQEEQGFSAYTNYDKYAERLKNEFPAEAIEYFWQRAYENIQLKKRKFYRVAVDYLNKAKSIYINNLNDANSWEERLSSLKKEFNNRPALLDEIKDL